MSFTIDTILKDVEKLPTIKTVAFEVIQLCSDKEVPIPKLVKVVSGDQSLASQILRIANSSFFNYPRTIYSLDRAIVILGFNLLRDIAVSLSIYSVYRNLKTNRQSEMKKLWRHAIYTGFALKSLAESYAPEQKEILYIGGLLHDIGKLVLLHILGEDYYLLLEKADQENARMADLEMKYFGFDHAQVGEKLATIWRLPDSVRDMVKFHHSPQEDELGNDNALLARIVYLGNLLVHLIENNTEDLESLKNLDPDFERYYSFTDVELEKLVEYIKNEISENEGYIKLFGINSV